MERRRTAVLCCSRFSNLARFHFLYRLKPIFAPVPTRFLPRSNPVFTPFFSRSCPFLFLFLSCSCTAQLSHLDARQLQPNHWTTSDQHWSAGAVGGLYSWRGDAREQFARYVCSRAWEQAERRRRKVRAQAAPITKRKEDSTYRTIGVDGRVRWVAAPSCLRRPTSKTQQFSILVNGHRLCRPQFSNCRAQALRTVCTGNPSC